MGAATDRPRALLADRRLHLLLLAGLVLRAVWLTALARVDPTLRELHSDAAYYDAWARGLAAGEAHRPGLPHWLPPLYPWVLSWLYGAGLDALGVVLALQALGGLAVTTILCALSERVVGRAGGLAAGWLWTLFAPVAYFETRLLGLNVALPLAALALWAGLAAVDACARAESNDGRSSRAGAAAPLGLMFACGLAAGLACLARPNLLLLPPLAGLAGLLAAGLGRRGATARRLVLLGPVLALGLALGLAPGLASNLERSGQAVLVSANGGVNFWFGNNPASHGTFHAPGPEWGAIEGQRDVALARASAALGRQVQEREASAWWFDQGLAWIAEEPLDAARLWALKLADALSSTEFGIMYSSDVAREFTPVMWLAPLPFGLLLALAVLGWRRAGRAEPLARWVLVGWIAGGLAGSLLYFTYSRFRMPWMLGLMPFAGAGALALWETLRGAPATRREEAMSLLGRAGAVAGLVALLALAQSFVPFEGDYPRLLRANNLVDVARAWEVQGRLDERRAPLERALELAPANAKALHELARLELTAGDAHSALAHLERAVAIPVDYPPALLELAALLATSHDPALADPARARALLENWLPGRDADDPLVGFARELLEQL